MFRRSLWVRYLAKLEPQINVHSHHFLPRLYTSHSAETSSPLLLLVSCQTMGQLDNEKATARALKAKATRIENARQAALESKRLAKETERGLTLCCHFKVKELTLLSPFRAMRCQDQGFEQPWFISICFRTWGGYLTP